jgi:hypothetical protein
MSQPPFSLPGRWFKGNLHTHSTQSDGKLTPAQAMAWYREHGYDFLALTDHWVYTAGQAAGDAPAFVTLGGAELHPQQDHDPQQRHLLAVGLQRAPVGDVSTAQQTLIDEVRAAGGLPFIAHPYWTGQTSAEIATLTGLAGMEVFNSVCEGGYGTGHSRVVWDELLSQGARLWGIAVDDTHWGYDEQGVGYVMVKAERLEAGAILEALRQGHFYASCGPTLHDLRLTRNAQGKLAVEVECSPCQHITFHGRAWRGHRFSAAAGQKITTAAWALDPDQVYVRVECCDAQGRVAWSNPLFLADLAL